MILHIWDLQTSHRLQDIVNSKVPTFCGRFYFELNMEKENVIISPELSKLYLHKKCKDCWNHPGVELLILRRTEL